MFEKGDDVVMKLGDAGTQVKPLSKDMAWRYFRDLLNGMSYCMSCGWGALVLTLKKSFL